MELVKKAIAKLNLVGAVRERQAKCRKCNDDEWIVEDGSARQCECRVRGILESRLNQLFSEFATFRGADLQNMEPRNDIQLKVQKVMLSHPEIGYWLEGESGAGKTHLLVAHFRECLIRGETSLWIGTEHEMKALTDRCRLSRKSLWWEGSVYPWESLNKHRLFLDDLGSVSVNDDYLADIYDVVDTHYRRNWPMSVTTNVSERRLIDIYGGRLTRRLLERCVREKM